MPLGSNDDQVSAETRKFEQPETAETAGDLDTGDMITRLPRSQTFKGQLSEHGLPAFASFTGSYVSEYTSQLPGDQAHYELSTCAMNHVPSNPDGRHNEGGPTETESAMDIASITASQYDAIIADELEQKWIHNLTMSSRDLSRKEKLVFTYQDKDSLRRRVTISLNYRKAPVNSLEADVLATKDRRDRVAKIYEAIRDSLSEIDFYDTVTNLKLKTVDGRLHVRVTEDKDQIISFPSVGHVQHIACKRVREKEVAFDSHMSGFVYKVRVHGQVMINKEIPTPDSVEGFLYEINALNHLRYSRDVVRLYGVVVDEDDDIIKGILIRYAEKGNLTDIIYDNCNDNSVIPWRTRQRWAYQIVRGLADIHNHGLVQGDLTLGNIVVDAAGDAKIIDINRRGCPTGCEPPELVALRQSHIRIDMYIGVKSDLYQLGMVLWALAMHLDDPEWHTRPLTLDPELNIPDWYRQMTEMCLSTEPAGRMEASSLLLMFPDNDSHLSPTMAGDDTRSLDEYSIGYPPSNGWQHSSKTYVDTSPDKYEPPYPARGRSPPRPLPSDLNGYHSPGKIYSSTSWAANKSVRPSYSDVDEEDAAPYGEQYDIKRRPETPRSLGKYDIDSAAYLPTDIRLEDISPKRAAMLATDRGPFLGDGLQVLSKAQLSREDIAMHDSMEGVTETQLWTVAPELQDYPADWPSTEVGAVGEMPDGHTVSDPQDIKPAESDMEGGVSLEREYDPSANGLPMQMCKMISTR